MSYETGLLWRRLISTPMVAFCLFRSALAALLALLPPRSPERASRRIDSESQWYTLFGFSPELDWRPLHFVEPIPPGRICSVCGLVPKVTGSLPCGHVVCKSCYQQCALGGSHACPLDGDACLEEDVYLRCFPADNLTRRQVRVLDLALVCNRRSSDTELGSFNASVVEYFVNVSIIVATSTTVGSGSRACHHDCTFKSRVRGYKN
ncbi:hypothetical protein HPB48_000607 [Haemaphysalis longicornis]|uniref:RING-type domain-containing protein n=1 Tax=Haemaphysalis longicornis TaxID=44386 RepID=A0A9J6GZY8_HAELO|nr:hypothetical protein HPB48_000607 [Haemaphysalis longicornis]